MHVEDDILNISPIINNRNAYPRGDKNGGDDSSMILLDDIHVDEAVTPKNTPPISNNITESRYLVLSSLHIDDPKYRIFLSKTAITTNVTIQKMTWNIDYSKIVEVPDDKGVIHSPVNLKCIVKVVDPYSPFLNMPRFLSLVYSETNVRDYQYKTKAATYHYL